MNACGVVEPRCGERRSTFVDLGSDRVALHPFGDDERGPEAAEGIEDPVARRRESPDDVLRDGLRKAKAAVTVVVEVLESAVDGEPAPVVGHAHCAVLLVGHRSVVTRATVIAVALPGLGGLCGAVEHGDDRRCHCRNVGCAVRWVHGDPMMPENAAPAAA
jgi:hypothetical protein